MDAQRKTVPGRQVVIAILLAIAIVFAVSMYLFVTHSSLLKQ